MGVGCRMLLGWEQDRVGGVKSKEWENKNR